MLPPLPGSHRVSRLSVAHQGAVVWPRGCQGGLAVGTALFQHGYGPQAALASPLGTVPLPMGSCGCALPAGSTRSSKSIPEPGMVESCSSLSLMLTLALLLQAVLISLYGLGLLHQTKGRLAGTGFFGLFQACCRVLAQQAAPADRAPRPHGAPSGSCSCRGSWVWVGFIWNTEFPPVLLLCFTNSL